MGDVYSDMVYHVQFLFYYLYELFTKIKSGKKIPL